MFTVGEFAHLAQVSKRLLRYYDEIGLLKPDHIGSQSGYRLYRAEQLSNLNHILALKELGLSLEQIRETLTHNISGNDLQEMLLIKKAEIEQQLETELRRIQMIEVRLASMQGAETKPSNIIIKEIPGQSVLSMRQVVDNFETAMEIYTQIKASLPYRLREQLLFCVCHNDSFVQTNLDMEFGLIVGNKLVDESVTLSNKLILNPRKLSGSTLMATTVVKGSLTPIHTGYAEIMRWAEQNRYYVAGMPREWCLQLPQKSEGHDLVTEIQIPIEPLPMH